MGDKIIGLSLREEQIQVRLMDDPHNVPNSRKVKIAMINNFQEREGEMDKIF